MLKRPSTELRLGALAEGCPNVPHALKNSDDFQRTCLRIIDHDVVRVTANRPEAKRPTRQIRADVAAQWPFRQEGTRFMDGCFHSVSSLCAVQRDVIPDLNKIRSRLRSEEVEVHPLC